MRVVRHWHRLPRQVGDAPSLDTFKARLDGALSNLIQLKTSLLIAGELDWMTLKGPFLPKLFYDSMISLQTALRLCSPVLLKDPPLLMVLSSWPSAEVTASNVLKFLGFCPTVRL